MQAPQGTAKQFLAKTTVANQPCNGQKTAHLPLLLSTFQIYRHPHQDIVVEGNSIKLVGNKCVYKYDSVTQMWAHQSCSK